MTTLQKIEYEINTNLSLVDRQKLIKNLLKNPVPSPKKAKKPKKISINDPRHPYYDKLSPEEEKGVTEALEDYKEGRTTLISTYQELEEHLQKLNKIAYEQL